MARLKQYDEQALIDRSQYGGSTFDQQHFTDDELRAAAQAREAYRAGQTDMKSAHDFVEGIRSKYGYSGGGNGSQYNKISYTQQTNQWNDTINALWDQVNGYGPFQDTREKPTYSNRYDQQINDLLQQYVNRGKFSYDYKNDPLYANYRKQYQREGQRATQDALAEAAAASGGIPSSYAASAAAQAQNYYASQIADKIPELERLAYQKYLDDASLQQSKISALQGQEQLDYAKYIDALGQYNTDRNFDYGVYSDRYNQLANNLGLAANQQSTQYSMETAAQGDALDRVQNFLKAGGKLADLDASLIARSGLTPAELKTYEAYYANQPSGGSGGRGGSGGSEEETTRQTGKGYIDNTYNRGGAGGIQSKTYDQLKRGMYEWIALGRKDKAYELFQGIVHQLNLGNSKGKKQYNELAGILNDAGFGIPLE